MTQQLAVDRVHPRRRFVAAVAEFVGLASSRRPRAAINTAPFDPELHMTPPFALLNTGPR